MEIEEFHLKIEISWGRYDANRQKSVNFVGSKSSHASGPAEKCATAGYKRGRKVSVVGDVESS